jgi:hypothetical protein
MKKRDVVSVKAGHLEFVKLNANRFDWIDTYHLLLSLTWPHYAVQVFGNYMEISIAYAIL